MTGSISSSGLESLSCHLQSDAEFEPVLQAVIPKTIRDDKTISLPLPQVQLELHAPVFLGQ